MKTKIEELRVAFEAATPGEWGVGKGNAENLLYGEGNFITEFPVYGCYPKEAAPNATFIALAHNLMPTLLEAANHLAECQELLHDYPWVYQECKRILKGLK